MPSGSLPGCLSRRGSLRGFAHGIATGCLLLLGGCVSIEQIAPPIGPALLSVSPVANTTELELGRHLYLTKCAKCHTPEPIHDYTRSEWQEILIEMNEETNLNAEEARAVELYVMGVLRLPPVTTL